jgi:hypothetical protein
MSAGRLAAIFGACLVLLVVLMTPVTVLISPQRLERAGLAVAGVDGNWRQAVLSDVSWRGYAIGQVTVQPLWSGLVEGHAFFRVQASGGRMQAHGVVGRGLFTSLQLRDVNVTADLVGLPVLVQLVGLLSAEIQEFDYGPQGCRRAVGTLKTDALSRGIAGLSWAGPALAGQLQCTDGAIVLPLASNTMNQRVFAAMTLKPDGTFEARIDVSVPDPSIKQILSQLGFRQEGDSFVLIQKGRWSN